MPVVDEGIASKQAVAQLIVDCFPWPSGPCGMRRAPPPDGSDAEGKHADNQHADNQHATIRGHMRAALLETPNSALALVDDLDVAEPGAGLVRVRVHHCGLCHSDLTII